MDRRKLDGCNVVILISNGYHEHEFWFPYYRFIEEEANVIVAGPTQGSVIGEGRHGKDGLLAEVEYSVNQVLKMDFDLLYLPGGIFSPLELRAHQQTLDLVNMAMKNNIMVSAICHAPWILASADVLRGRKLTCPSDIITDIENAGGIYLNQDCVRDGNLITAEYYRYLPQQFRVLLPAMVEYLKLKN